MNKQPILVRFAQWLISKYSNQSNETEPMGMGLGISLAKRKGTQTSRGSILRDESTAINFTIHAASGGYVVESSYYDDRTDNHNRQLHIITSQEDFSEELGKAVFMDILKRR